MLAISGISSLSPMAKYDLYELQEFADLRLENADVSTIGGYVT
jgi:hypothetical protein